jgi:hypothetical protein
VTQDQINNTATAVYKLYDVTATDSEGKEIKLNRDVLRGDDGKITSVNYTFPQRKVKKKVPYFTLTGKLPKKHAKTRTVTELENKYQSLTLILRQQDLSRYLTLMLSSDDFAWHFDINTKSELKYFNSAGKLIDLRDVKYTKFFKGKENMFSGRGYIWSRALPLIPHTLLIGYGADTLPFYYPQDDYVGKYNARWNFGTIVDKPHSMYIALAVNNGLLALGFYFLLLLMFLIQGIKIYWRHFPKDFISYTGLGIFFGVIGFTVSGISNDSTVSVMPLFYGILALGFTANLILKKRFADEEKELAEKGMTYKEYEMTVLEREKTRRKKVKAEKKAIRELRNKGKKPSKIGKLISKLPKPKAKEKESDDDTKSVLDKAKKK